MIDKRMTQKTQQQILYSQLKQENLSFDEIDGIPVKPIQLEELRRQQYMVKACEFDEQSFWAA